MIAEILFAAALGQFSVVDSVEHDSRNYTQGLFFDSGVLYESTGQYGDSRLLRYRSVGGAVSDSVKIGRGFFGEGSVRFGNDIFWLTWREGVAFVLDAKTLEQKSNFPIPGEGWGLTVFQNALVLSDGSATLFFLSPGDKRIFKTLEVKDGERSVSRGNELEMVGNFLYANVWQSDSVAVIDMRPGSVLEWLDFSEISRKLRKRFLRAEVLNGIAYDGKFLWINGKYWPVMYKVQFSPQMKKSR